MEADVYIKFCIKKGNSSLPYSDPEGWAGATFKTWLRHCTLWNCFYYTSSTQCGTASIIRPPACGTPTPLYGTPGSKGTHHLYCLRSYHRSYLTCYRAHIRTSSTLSPMSLIEPSQGHSVRNHSKTLPVVIHHISNVATTMCCPPITHVPKYRFLFITVLTID